MMKKFKRLAAILLAAVMVLSLGTTVFADDEEATTGSITITGVSEGETYDIYKIFDLTIATDSDGEVTAYSYQIVSAWEDFIGGEDYEEYFTLSDDGYLSTDSTIFDEDCDLDMAAFAKAALAYAEENDINATDTKVADDTSVTFSDLELGYYLVGTTLGSLCMLDSTDTDAEIDEKNGEPTASIYVQDASDKNETNDDDADVIDTLQYEIVLTSLSNGKNVVIHNTLSADLEVVTGDDGEPAITIYVNSTAATSLTAGTVTQVTDGDGNTTYTLESGDYGVLYTAGTDGDDNTLIIVFSDSYLENLDASDVVTVVYQAKIDAESSDFSGEFADYKNEVQVTYGANQESEVATAEVFSYGFELYKYTQTDADDEDTKAALAGAKFVLSYEDDGTTYYATFDTSTSGTYILTGWVEDIDDATEIESIADDDGNNVIIEGISHKHTYTLTETEAPDGYNLLDAGVTVEIVLSKDGEGNTIFTSFIVKQDNTELTDKVVSILNQTGIELPGTGGMGTTIFYVVGIILVLAAAVILITRRRMNAHQ